MVPDPWMVISAFFEANKDMNPSPDDLIHALEDGGFRIVSIHSTDWALGYD
jgi:hypothetical protein